MARWDDAAAPPGRVMRQGEHGFTLLEILIAFAIAAAALSMLVQAAAEGRRAVATALRYEDAVSRARSHLDGAYAALVPGDQDGSDGRGFRWRVAVRALESTGKRDAAGRQVANTDGFVLTLYAVTVWITWKEGGNERAVRLDSKRLVAAAPA